MANLKGATFEKQIKNAKIRLEARGVSRHNKQDKHLTHSNALALKRDTYLKEFAQYASSLNLNESKLNNYFTAKIITDFLHKKIENLTQKSAINYTRGFSAMLQGLQHTGITVQVNSKLFDKVVQDIKSTKNDTKTAYNREIKNSQEIINKLNEISPKIGAVATIQLKLGLRVSEAIELLKYSQKYLKQDNMIHNLIGKGNHTYEQKPISKEIYQLLQNNYKVNYQEYQTALKSLRISSHDFRYTYVYNRMRELVKTMPYKDALLKVSTEINHKRAEITTYYLSNTSF